MSKSSDYIWTWFLDPYLRTVTPLEIPKKLSAWHEAIQCDCLDMLRLQTRAVSGRFIDVWVDDCGQLRQPPLATFSVEGHLFYGYGLMFEGDAAGETYGVSFDVNFLGRVLNLCFDGAWEKRYPNLELYFPQLTRVIKWEKWHAPIAEKT